MFVIHKRDIEIVVSKQKYLIIIEKVSSLLETYKIKGTNYNALLFYLMDEQRWEKLLNILSLRV